MTDTELETELSTGEAIPVRRVGEFYIVAYEYMDPKEFLRYVDMIFADEGATHWYDEDDVMWYENGYVSIEADSEKLIVPAHGREDTFPVTVIELW